MDQKRKRTECERRILIIIFYQENRDTPIIPIPYYPNHPTNGADVLRADDYSEAIYDEIGARCPFKLANHLGIKLHYLDLGEDICGFYKTSPLGAYHIVLNSNLDIDEMQSTSYLLLKHHRVGDKTDLILDFKDISAITRVESSAMRYLKIASRALQSLAPSRSR